MARTVTLRLDDDAYAALREAAKAERRPLSNLIETAALARIREQQFEEPSEPTPTAEGRVPGCTPASGPHRCVSTASSRRHRPETWRYRIGAWRFFYEIDEARAVVSMTAASHRGSAY
jgi:hypothetical protein